MDETIMAAFSDELEKISIAMPAIPGGLQVLKYPLMLGGGIAGWEHLKKMKNRYDIGKQVQQQMAARG